jgi:hypothetical protein
MKTQINGIRNEKGSISIDINEKEDSKMAARGRKQKACLLK